MLVAVEDKLSMVSVIFISCRFICLLRALMRSFIPPIQFSSLVDSSPTADSIEHVDCFS